MEKRSKFALKADKSLKAMGAGERTSKKVSTIRKADGTSFKRKNANQYVDAGQAGGNEYTEKRVNRTDIFNTGGTADSSENGGADMGGTLGSSMMKTGGSVGTEKEYKSIDIGGGNYVYTNGDKISPSNLVVGNIYEWTAGAERLFVEYVGREKDNADKKVGSSIGKQEGGNLYLFKFIGDSKPSYTGLSGMAITRGNIVKQDNIYNEIEDSLNDEIKQIKKRITQAKREITTSKSESDKSNAKNRLAKTETYLAEQMKSNKELLESLKDKKMANGGGLADVPESFPETDAMSYKKGGVSNDFDDMEDTELFDAHTKEAKKNKVKWIEEVSNGDDFIQSKTSKGMLYTEKDSSGNITHEWDNEYAQGGSTKGFEYSIGGL
jgi:hypothetical protein